MSDSRNPPRDPSDLPDAHWPTAIRFARISLRMSQEQLADAVAVGRGTVNAWENGKTPVGAQSRLALVKLFGDKLLEAPPPLDASERAYWRGRVEQVATQTRMLLEQQLQLAGEMHHPPRNLPSEAHPTAATRATAIETVKRSAPAAADLPAPHTTPRRRRRG